MRTGSNLGKHRLRSGIDESRILALSNDLSENIASGTIRDWRAVAWYWRDKFDRISRSHDDIRQSVAALSIGSKMIIESRREMDKWLDALKQSKPSNRRTKCHSQTGNMSRPSPS